MNQHRFRLLRTILREDGGGVAVYAAMAAITAVGAGAVAIDVGRMSVLRTQMQDAVDAAAMAAAAQLDGRTGAQNRARSVAQDTMEHSTAFAADKDEIKVKQVNFYIQYAPKVAATNDTDSAIVEVVMEGRRVDFLFQPILNFVTAAGPSSKIIQTIAAARPEPYICHAPPLMICDYGDKGGGVHDDSLDLRNEAHIGKQVRLKEQGAGGTWAPGNFGLLSLPDGSSGASDLEAALAALSPEDCYSLDVTTATGSKTEKIKNAVNSRFDIPGNPWPYPAANVIAYPRDAEIIADPDQRLGSGNWDLSGYWTAKHGGSVPSALAGATRYQVYLWELGLKFARNGKQTLYPLPDTLPAGYQTITPPSASVPVTTDTAKRDNPLYDGEPRATNPPYYKDPTKDYKRRLVHVVQLQCKSNDVKGKHDYPTQANYLEVFITEDVKAEPNANLYAEVVRKVTPTNSPEFHANVRLIR